MGPKVFYLFTALLLVCQVCQSEVTPKLSLDECGPSFIDPRPCPEGYKCVQLIGCNTRRKRGLEHEHPPCPFKCSK